MIQRIQTIYLLLAGAAFAALFLLPFASSNQPIPDLLTDQVYDVNDSPILLGITIAGILCAVVGIFLFKNRPLQQKLTIFTIICAVFVALVAIVLMYNEKTAFDQSQAVIDDEAGLFMPVASILFAYLAYRGIRKDENLVRSMDRLR